MGPWGEEEVKRRFTAERSDENEWWDDRRAKTGGMEEVAWRAGGEWKTEAEGERGGDERRAEEGS